MVVVVSLAGLSPAPDRQRSLDLRARYRATTKLDHMKKTVKKDQLALALGKAKLELSGLDEDDAQQLGIEFLGAEATAALHDSFKPLPSLKLPYFNPDGSPLSSWPGHPPFYRLRYLDSANDFSKLTTEKPKRYVQEPESGVAAYFPRNVDWLDLALDVDQPLLITEGELKAAKACKEGFPTIGLGGVYNYRSAKLGLPFLPSLGLINWVKRHVYIVYDSDYRTNPQVCRAINALAQELQHQGSYVYVVSLPDVVEGAKTGLDDYLTLYPSGVVELRSLLHQAQPLTLAAALWRMNDEVLYVRDPGLILVKKTRQKVSPNVFKDHLYAAETFAEQSFKADGSIDLKRASAAQAWLKWPHRGQARDLVYEPGRPSLIDNDDDYPSWNDWKGWGVEPKPGDVEPFLKLVNHLFAGLDDGARDWFLRWLAYPLQYPGTKLFSSCLIYGVNHGTGKSLIGYTMGRIYGPNFTEIKQKDLQKDFNSWSLNRQFILADDVSGTSKRQDADMLKTLVTQKEIRVNVKYVPEFTIRDVINWYFTANHPDTFFLEDDDRRFFIWEVPSWVRGLEEEFYVDYQLWLDSGGASALFDYLLHLDLGDFNPAGRAYGTTAKQRMVADVKSDLGSWVSQLLGNPDAFLRVGEAELPGDLFTNKQLLALYDPTGKTGTTANGLGRELRRAGALMVCEGKPVRTRDGQDRYYVLRHPERWKDATAQQVTAHVEQRHQQEKTKKKY